MKPSIHSLFLTLLLLLFCEFSGSMYNPDDPSYEKPLFTIDTSASSFTDGDTVVADTVDIT